MADFIDTESSESVQDDGVNTGRFEGEETFDSDVEEMLKSFSCFKHDHEYDRKHRHGLKPEFEQEQDSVDG